MTETPKKHKIRSCHDILNSSSSEKNSTQNFTSKRTSHLNHQRQLSSLDGLTKKFIQCIKEKGEENIDINEIVKKLKVKKRRIYDITNVLEGIKYIKKSAKNKLQWLNKDTLKEPISFSMDESSDHNQNLVKEIEQVRSLCAKVTEENMAFLQEQKDKYDFLTFEDFQKILNKNSKVACVRSDGQLDIEESSLNRDAKMKKFREENRKLNYGYNEENILLASYKNRLYFTSTDKQEVEVYWITNESENEENQNNEHINENDFEQQKNEDFSNISHDFNQFGLINIRKESLP